MEIISNKELIEPSEDNKEIIEQIKQDHDSELKSIDYPINDKTGKVKDNDMFMFYNEYLEIRKPKQPISKQGKNLKRELNLKYIEDIKDFRANIKKYKNKKYKKLDKLEQDIFNFNLYFETNYYNGFNVRIKDLLDKDIAKEFIQKQASAIAYVQADNIIKIGIENFIKLDLQKPISAISKASDKYIPNNNATNLKIYIDILDLIKLQEFYSKNNLGTGFNEIILRQTIYQYIINDIADNIEQEIKDSQDIYSEVHKLYTKVNQDILDIVNNFRIAREGLSTLDELGNVVIVQPQKKTIPLLVPTIFNNTYINSKYTQIYNKDKLSIQIKLDLDINVSDIRENIIFYDNLTKQRIDLLPIDYAIFIACTELNATNKSLSGISGNVPITIDNIIQYIADNDTLYRTKKRQKALYDYIIDRLTLYRVCIVDAVYTKSGELKKLYKEPMPLLYTNQYYNPTTNDDSFIVGASAILTLINQIEKLENKPYLASYTRAREFINDGQNNTIEILNTKYYILPKLLQRINAKSKGQVYQPIISLEDLYKSIALLKGKESLSRSEQKRVRDSAFNFLEHLKAKKLLQEYDTKPLTDKTNKLTTKANQKIKYIYTKPNYKASL